MSDVAQLLKPNICVGNTIINKVCLGNQPIQIENYFPSYLPFTNSSTPARALKDHNNNYHYVPNLTQSGLLTSTNMQNWKFKNLTLTNASSATTFRIRDMVCAENIIVAVGWFFTTGSPSSNFSNDFCIYSTDSYNWLSAKLPTNNRWSSVTHGNGTFVAVAGEGESVGSQFSGNIAAYSFDGINWNTATLPFSSWWQRVGYANETFVAIPSRFSQTLLPGQILSGAISQDGINWTAVPILTAYSGAPAIYGWGPIQEVRDVIFVPFNLASTRLFFTSYDGITWDQRLFPDWSLVVSHPPLSSYSGMRNVYTVDNKFVIRPYAATRSCIELVSDNGIDWTARKSSLSAAIITSFQDNNNIVHFEHSINAKSWRIWNTNRFTNNRVLYSAHFIPLNITQNNGFFRFDQLGTTNNPTLTCYRETNYDFIVSNGLTGNPFYFALRNNINNTTSVPGAFNNNALDGLSASRIMFTPTSATPDSIFYVNTRTPSMSGRIVIRNY